MIGIVYLHGFRSSPQSAKATQFARAVDAVPAPLRPWLWVPDLGHRPAAAVASVADRIELEGLTGAGERLCFVGSSLGGYYATQLAERYASRAVLINPAVRPFDDLRRYAGMQTNLHTAETFEVTADHFAELAALRVTRISNPERYFLLVQSGDEVLDWRESVAFYGGAFQSVEGGGDHAFQWFDAQIPAILRFAGVRVTDAGMADSGAAGP